MKLSAYSQFMVTTGAKQMENIQTICETVYGCGIAAAPVEAVLWSAERISDKAKAREELSRANRIRSRHGKPLAYAPYGHHAF